MENINNPESIEIPEAETDYHGHPNYLKIFYYLMFLFALSLTVGAVFSPVAGVIVIFATAAWKSALVVKNFMHLSSEPLLIWVAVAAVLFCLIAFFFGVYPDITAVAPEIK